MARNITVTFADGTSHVYQNAPDDVTPDQVEARATKEFGKPVKALDGGRAPTTAKKEPGINDRGGLLQNMAGAVLSGAGSIGATLLAPYDYGMDMLDRGLGGDKVADKSLTGIINGEKKLNRNEQRRADIDAALRTAGVDTDSTSFGLTRLGTQIAGTAGAGGAVANGITRFAPAVAKVAPSLVEAIRTSGFSANGAKGLAGLAARTAGGAVSGGVSAGMIDPETAGTGAAIGAVLPGSVQAVGKVANAVGKVIRGPQVAPEIQAAVKEATDLGYVIPPTQAKPTLVNRVLEGFSGKLTTAQNASAKNANVTNTLANRALGLADDVKLTPEVLEDVRKAASGAYKELANLPVKPAVEANSLMNIPAQAEINPSKMVFDLRKARNEATAWYNSYGRTADPDSLAKAQAAKALASELESTLEGYAKSLGRDDLVSDMAAARQLIAKTYSVEKALNGTTGNVDARKLAQQLSKGKPLSGELKQAAQFAERFPKAAQNVEGMGSLPQTSPLDWFGSSALSVGTGNPLALLAVGARPAARAGILSAPFQRGLSNPQSTNQLMQLLSSPEGQQLLMRTAPAAITSR